MGLNDKKMSGEAERKFLVDTLKVVQKTVDAEVEERQRMIQELRFADGEQWPEEEVTRRTTTKRLMLVVNTMPTLIKQVTGDQRLNTPQIKVRPEGDDADVETALVRQGMLRNIDYESTSETVHDTAANSQVTCGYGAWRVITEYRDNESFKQRIKVVSIKNPFMMYLDPNAMSPVGADARYGFLFEKVSRADFKKEYPKATAASVSSDSRPSEGGSGGDLPTFEGMQKELWWEEDTVTKCEYFVKEFTKREIVQMSDGSVVDRDQVAAAIAMNEAMMAEAVSMAQQTTDPVEIPLPLTELRSRVVDDYKIMQYIFTGAEILEGPNEWPGKYIPLVPVYGDETNIAGERHLSGLIRHAIDPARLRNYWTTVIAETIALAPKVPVVGTAKQFKGYQGDWRKANTDSIPYLMYNPDPEAPGPPKRLESGGMPQYIFAERKQAEEDIEKTTGMFKASIGADSNEKSGIALRTKQQESDVGTFLYHDNLRRSIEHSARIQDDLLSKIYDTAQDARLKNEDGSESLVPINTTAGEALAAVQADPDKYSGMDTTKLKQIAESDPDKAYNDMTKGTYVITVLTGPSYTTARQEAVENLLELARVLPAVAEVGGDMIVGNMDIKGADELRERMEKLLPPNMRKPKEGEPPEPPAPPSPEEQIAMKELEIKEGELVVKAAQVEVDKLKIQGEMAQSKADMEAIAIKVLTEATEGQ